MGRMRRRLRLTESSRRRIFVVRIVLVSFTYRESAQSWNPSTDSKK